MYLHFIKKIQKNFAMEKIGAITPPPPQEGSGRQIEIHNFSNLIISHFDFFILCFCNNIAYVPTVLLVLA